MEPWGRPDSAQPSTHSGNSKLCPVLYFPCTNSSGYRHVALGLRNLQGPRVKDQTAGAEVEGEAGGLWDLSPETADLVAKGHLPAWSQL